MKQKFVILMVLILTIFLSVSCSKKTSTKELNSLSQKQKAVVVVVDKQTKTPIKDAKVYIIGDNNIYTTDEMGKTSELQIEIDKEYFKRYGNEIAGKMSCGFANFVIVKEGYGKHMEIDYNIYPGNSTTVVKIEISKGNKNTLKVNEPDSMYIENLVNIFKDIEGNKEKFEDSLKYKVSLMDENKKPVEGVKVVIPEYRIVGVTDAKGNYELEVPKNDTAWQKYKVKKNYDEITILTYKDGYIPNVILKAQVNKDGKNNSAFLKIKKSERKNLEYKIMEPDPKWIQDMLNSYN